MAKPIRSVVAQYRCKLFYKLRAILPRTCKVKFQFRGSSKIINLEPGRLYEDIRLRRVYPLNIIDMIVYTVSVYRRKL